MGSVHEFWLTIPRQPWQEREEILSGQADTVDTVDTVDTEDGDDTEDTDSYAELDTGYTHVDRPTA